MRRLRYAGIDVHKETMDVFVYRGGEQHVFVERTIPNREKTVKKVFGKLLEGGSVICSARHFISSSLNALLLHFGEVIVPENPCSDRSPGLPTLANRIEIFSVGKGFQLLYFLDCLSQRQIPAWPNIRPTQCH